VRSALAWAPFDRNLRHAYLDMFHEELVAESQFIREGELADLAAYRLGLLAVPANQFIIDKEIAVYTNLIARWQTTLERYGRLLTDSGGVDVVSVDATAAPGTRFGWYVFREEQPFRNQMAAQFLDADGVIRTVPDLDPPTGRPLTNGAYQLEFRIYDDATAADAANLVWGPFLLDDQLGYGHSARAILIGGRFNVILGPEDTARRSLVDAFKDATRFVEIRVNGGQPIQPRQQFLSAPYARQAVRAQEAGLAVIAARLENLEQNQALCPPGTILAYAGTNAPPGWLPCDGRAPRSSEQPRLFAAIGQAWGDGTHDSNNVAENPPDETTDFNLPDLRGLFLRGATAGSTNSFFRDPDAATRLRSRPGGNAGDAVGSVQADEFKSHNHTAPPYQYIVAAHPEGWNSGKYWDTTPGEIDSLTGLVMPRAGGNETRPRNASVLYIIKL
jgi:hypothetical protein